MTKCNLYPPHTREFLFVLLALFALPISASLIEYISVQGPQTEEIQAVQKWEPSEQDQIQVKLLSYQFLKAKDEGNFNAAFSIFAESTKSSIDFKQWKYQALLFNATAGAVLDRTFTRITWFENPPDEALPGIFATVDYSGVFTNVDIQCGYLMWHKNPDGNFELIREQENFMDKTTQEKLSDNEIAETRTKFACKDQ